MLILCIDYLRNVTMVVIWAVYNDVTFRAQSEIFSFDVIKLTRLRRNCILISESDNYQFPLTQMIHYLIHTNTKTTPHISEYLHNFKLSRLCRDLDITSNYWGYVKLSNWSKNLKIHQQTLTFININDINVRYFRKSKLKMWFFSKGSTL